MKVSSNKKKNNVMNDIKNRVRIKQIMKFVDIRTLLDLLGISYERKRPGELLAHCPNHSDDDPSWEIHSRDDEGKGQHHCWSCSWGGGPVKLVMKVLDMTYSQAVEWLETNFVQGQQDDDFLYKTSMDSKSAKDEIQKKTQVYVDLPKEFMPLVEGNKYYDYAISRGLTPQLIKEFGLGYCSSGFYVARMIVPVRMKDRQVTFFARSIIRNINKKKKSLYPKGPLVSLLLWPYDRLDFNLIYAIIVEGPLDALRLISLGYKNVLCIFGNRISEEQSKLLKPFKHIILIPDADGEMDDEGSATKGQVMVQTAKQYLMYNHKVSITRLPENNDPGDVDPEVLKQCLRNKEPIIGKQKLIVKVDYSISKE